jgi:hypothetical protein
MPYEHPEIKKRRISVAVSPEHEIYVEYYHSLTGTSVASEDIFPDIDNF